ncbi:MAG: hypothetical protein ACREQM_18330 [Candidatus Dormibacteraceae bacterium]
MHLSLPWGSTTERHHEVPELTRSIGAAKYCTTDAELLAEGRGPVQEEKAIRIEVDPFPDRFDVTYGRRYFWHLLRDPQGRYFLVVNRRDIKPIGSLEAACRWASATHVFGSGPVRSRGVRLRS